MDIDKIRRRRAIKVILTDILMAVSVVAIVSILVAVVAGWRFNADFSLEQNGLVSLRSYPNGATVIIDGDEESQTTKTSKMLPGGEHKIVLQKDGYESWEKTVKITPGWLVKLEYPRLFKQDRSKESIKKYQALKAFYVSPSKNTAILLEDDSTNWVYISDFNGTPKFTKINVQGIFSDTDDGVFDLEIKSLEWDKNDDKVLIHAVSKNEDEFVVVDLRDIKKSVNLTENYARYKANSSSASTGKNSAKVNITKVVFEDEAGGELLVIANNNLVRINTEEQIVSENLVENITDFYQMGNEIVYATTVKNGKFNLEMRRLGDKRVTVIAELKKGQKTTFALTKFNSYNYLIYTIDNILHIYCGRDFPNGTSKISGMKLLQKVSTGIISSSSQVSLNNEFIVFRNETKVVVFDAELEDWYEYDYGDEDVRFLDDFLMYRVEEDSGKFLVWDFDGTNVRTLVVDKGLNNFDALITPNNRYFYYIAKSVDGVELIREKL